MAAALSSPHLAATLPSLRPPARRPSRAASLLPPRGARIALRRSSRHPYPSSRNSGWFENAARKKALFASETDSPSTEVSKQSSTGDANSSPHGPPVLTILAGIAVFFLLLWVIGSIFTWIVGLVFGAAKS
ncbi:hypothetical protein CFC21_068715 [Triticum aestivum]|uniref:Uncharacterized protein n=2 Tax=Triticum aestivum TaxID=4565 RepID=A0A3B6KSQ5_WHEAT|nr:uncharacterized protein LOC119303923 [Triticum dicoccoides]KAF7062072.1 hypothetical protein CFC21_068715 [Triticum aestivum]